MGRGILSGLFWGGAASMIALMAASVYLPLRDISARLSEERVVEDRPFIADPPVADVVEEPEQTPPPAEPEVAQLPSPQQPEEPEVVPAPEAVEVPSPAVVQLEDTAPALAAPERNLSPETRSVQSETGVPSVEPAPTLTPSPDAVTPSPAEAAAVLRRPLPDPELSDAAPRLERPIIIARSQPAARDSLSSSQPAGTVDANPVLPAFGSLADATAPARPRGLPDRVVPDLTVLLPEIAAPQPIPPLGITAPPASDLPRVALAPSLLPLPPVTPLSVTGDAPPEPPVATPAPVAPVVDDSEPEPEPEPEPPQQVATVVVPPAPAPELAPDTLSPGPSANTLPRRFVVGQGARQFGSGGPGLSSRLPRIGEATARPAAAVVPPQIEDTAPVGALDRNAVPFTPRGTEPLLSIILRATSDARAVTDVLAGIDHSLAVTLDPTWPEAPARAAELRAAGHEVLIELTGLPDQPEPRDIDTALAVHIARLPEAMGVWLPQDSVILSDRQLLRHTVEVLRDTGHGLGAALVGLDAAGQEARAAGVPAALTNRTLDGPGSSTEAVARALEQGALRTGIDGSSVLLAETRVDTLIALRDWAATAPRGAFQLSPVSAQMRLPQS